MFSFLFKIVIWFLKSQKLESVEVNTKVTSTLGHMKHNMVKK